MVGNLGFLKSSSKTQEGVGVFSIEVYGKLSPLKFNQNDWKSKFSETVTIKFCFLKFNQKDWKVHNIRDLPWGVFLAENRSGEGGSKPLGVGGSEY